MRIAAESETLLYKDWLENRGFGTYLNNADKQRLREMAGN